MNAKTQVTLLAENFEITDPDADGLLWLVLHGKNLTGRAMFNLGSANLVAGQVALKFEEERRAALLTNVAREPVAVVVSVEHGINGLPKLNWYVDFPNISPEVNLGDKLYTSPQPADEALPKDLTDEQIDALMPEPVYGPDTQVDEEEEPGAFTAEQVREVVRAALKQRLGSQS